MSQPVNCRYFFGDYHRGANLEKCRLLEASPNNGRPWRRKLCDSCPVPEVLHTSTCLDLLLEAEVQRSFLRERVAVTFVVCARHLHELDDPYNCPECAAEQNRLRDG
ncbi:MAG: hypothetical protein HY328_12425 [Chloroflexi bacterium]|nr:hypothetical protein [Chloroflexota bacterium]